MVRIAGIDRELSPLEILWAQATDEERLNLTSSYLANITTLHGAIELKVELENDQIIIINTKLQGEKK